MRVGTAIFLAFLGLYLLAGSRTRPWADATPMWQVAESLVTKQSIAVTAQWNTPPGKDGRIYAVHPLLDSLEHVPGAALRAAASRFVKSGADLFFPMASHLGPSLLAALTCLLFYRLARRFASARTASIATLFVGLGTGVFYYARSAYSESLQAFCFTGYVLALFDALDDPSAPAARRLGIWATLLFSSKLVYLVAIPGVACVFAWQLRREPRKLLVFFAWAALMMVPGFVVIFVYNWLRWGSILDSGYGPIGGAVLWRGLWGLFLSPGKSVFLYSPPLVAAAFGFRALFRDQPRKGLALALAITPVVLVYARFLHWDGDWAWGPRYLNFLLPVCCLPLVVAIDAARSRSGRWVAALLGVVFAAGVTVQVLGAALYWGHWFRIAGAASDTWLGKPRCSPTSGVAEPCYPDDNAQYMNHWLPPLTPVAGHFWLLRHAPFGDSFEQAEADAPWQYGGGAGKVHIPAAADWYRNTVVDWWALAFGDHPILAAGLGAVMVALLAGGAVVWVRRERASPGAPDRPPPEASP